MAGLVEPQGEHAEQGGAGAIPAELAETRRAIDNIDAALIHILAERFRYTQRVGYIKATAGLPPSDPAREAVQVERLRRLATEAGLDPVFAAKFLAFVVAEVIHHHERIREEHAASGEAGDDVAAPTGSAETDGTER
ncbi:chorismate mutase [Buchananella felis]|uniref:chorismate mutase n=1 Tax=Buchananella felis TaxID=3231492 RepID=UPI0035283000